jgi:thiol-disulfide isomerase/thioredoxin
VDARADHPAALSAAALALATALGLLLLACAATGPAPAQRPPGPVALLDLEGRARSLAPEPGAPALVVHFWATWCPSCVEELGALSRASAACPGGPVRVVAVNVGEDRETIARFLAGQQLALDVLRDAGGALWRSAEFRALPANWFWTREGRSAATGPLSDAEWTARLRELGCTARGPS